MPDQDFSLLAEHSDINREELKETIALVTDEPVKSLMIMSAGRMSEGDGKLRALEAKFMPVLFLPKRLPVTEQVIEPSKFDASCYIEIVSQADQLPMIQMLSAARFLDHNPSLRKAFRETLIFTNLSKYCMECQGRTEDWHRLERLLEWLEKCFLAKKVGSLMYIALVK